MRIVKFEIQKKTVTLRLSDETDRPLIVFNGFSEDAVPLFEMLNELKCPECNLAYITSLDWEREMTPWHAPALSAKERDFSGEADAYLKILLEDIIPAARKEMIGKPAFTGIAGYSLAGLFALYTLYRCDAFARAASMSGSLWFPDFADFAVNNEMQKKPEKVYLSLGDKECRSRNPLLREVQNNTEKIASYYKGLGIDVRYELNEGNHFKDELLRTAKGIRGICHC